MNSEHHSTELSLLEKTIVEEPIPLPGNAFVEGFKEFFTDEGIAWVINTGGTAIADKVLKESWKKAALPWVGPIIEKAGFFPKHIYDAVKIYKTLPSEVREQRGFLNIVRKELAKGGENLGWDLGVHDPLYVGLMYLGMNYYPEAPAAALSFASFGLALCTVAALKIGKDEIAYGLKRQSFTKLGFGHESYLEARFYVRSDDDPRRLLDNMVERFGLSNPEGLQYHDTYFDSTLPEFTGRKGKLRLRERQRGSLDRMRMEQDGYVSLPGENPDFVRTVQITYSRVKQSRSKKTEQYNYFPSKKEKLYFILAQDMPLSLQEIEDPDVRRALQRYQDPTKRTTSINFERTVAANEELLVTTDRVDYSQRPFYVVELKVFSDTELLQAAMREVMASNHVISEQTTLGKADMLCDF